MEAGAKGAEIVLSGKVTGARSRVEKFNRGYIKHNGEPAEDIVDHGVGTAVMKLGTIGVQVKVIPPDAELPDDFEIYEGVEVEDYVAADEDGTVEELLEGEPEEAQPVTEPEVDEEAGPEVEVDEEVIEEELDEEPEDVEVPGDDEVEEELADLDEAVDEELDEDTEAEAEELMDEMSEASSEASEGGEATEAADEAAENDGDEEGES
jgi:small subunit ribosomal protein S3